MDRTASVFDGTLPVLPFDQHRETCLGNVNGASGTPPQVLALAAEADGTLVALHVLGYQTACSAHFARLWQNEPLSFQPAFGVAWDGPDILRRSTDWSYQEIGAPLKETHVVSAMGITRQANIDYGLKVPPAFPATESTIAEGQPDEDAPDSLVPRSTATSDLTGAAPRFMFGNLHETTPAPAALQGHLRALRLVHLYDTSTQNLAHCTRIWLEQLWLQGLVRDLIVPIGALGLRAWRLSGDLTAWAALVRGGLAAGWLPRP